MCVVCVHTQVTFIYLLSTFSFSLKEEFIYALFFVCVTGKHHLWRCLNVGPEFPQKT